uniref:ABC transmembrane type-1 domain-containing protein n=1 Tax=Oryza brachyantha TaxID=4533 RepID=J3M1W8_ORYBR
MAEIACWMYSGERQVIALRKAYLDAVLRQDVGFFDTDARTGDIVFGVSTDTLLVQDAIGEKVGNFIHYIATFLAGLVVGFVAAWRLALLSVAVIPAIAFAGGLYAYTLTGLTSKSRESYANAGVVAEQVSLPSFSLGLPAYYKLASSEACSNLSRYDGIRYGRQVSADDLNELYGGSQANGLGHEVKMRILMGTYALSAGYYDAYYKRAQQVRTLVKLSFKEALDRYNILVSPAAPSAAYKIGEKTNDPLAMYAGDIMTVNVNLAGLPALVVPCGFVEGGSAGLPVGLQMIGSPFSEGNLLRVGHIFEQTLQNYSFVPPLLTES